MMRKVMLAKSREKSKFVACIWSERTKYMLQKNYKLSLYANFPSHSFHVRAPL